MTLCLDDKTVHLWLGRLDILSDPGLLSACRTQLPESEQDRCQRLLTDRDRHRALLSRILVRTVLSCYTPTSPAQWRFTASPQGKPELSSHDLKIGFNLSHSGNLVVCGVCLQPSVGVDTQAMTPQRNHLAIARRFFSPREYRDITALSALRQAERFYDLWTLKESYLKATGAGLSIPLNSFAFCDEGNGGFSLASPEGEPLEGSGWQHQLITLDNQRIAVSRQADTAGMSLRHFPVTLSLIADLWQRDKSLLHPEYADTAQGQ